MRVYHFISSEYGLIDIKHRRLKISRLEDLNDPFESLSLEQSDRKIRSAHLRKKAQLNRTCGILCFSENWNSSVMWSHYAEKHKGLCLEFEIPDKLLAKINYRKNRLKTAVKGLSNAPAEADELSRTRLLTIKFAHWKYEQEWRRIIDLGTPESDGHYYEDFSEQLKLTGIVVGPRSSVSRKELDEALEFSQIKNSLWTFKSRLAFSSFRVIKNKDQSLWQ